MHEGVGDHLEDRLVDLRFAAGDDDGDGLPFGLGQVPDGPREPEEEPVELDHAGGRDLLLQAVRKIVEMWDVSSSNPSKKELNSFMTSLRSFVISTSWRERRLKSS